MRVVMIAMSSILTGGVLSLIIGFIVASRQGTATSVEEATRGMKPSREMEYDY